MATAAVARPSQPRASQRRDGLKPNVTSLKRASLHGAGPGTAGDDGGEPASKKQKMDREPPPAVRTREWILKKHAGKPPSMVLHLHPSYFRFDTQEGSYAYDGPMKFIIDAVRKQIIPHEMLEEIHANNVPFYDGCLIIEIHNHRTVSGKAKGRYDSAAGDRYSMHVYNNYITPSGFAPYPKKAKEEPPESDSGAKDKATEKGNSREKDGPEIASVVLFPTELSAHYDMMILARTPASELTRNKKKNADGAQPPTPSLAVPPTPIVANRGAWGDGKMCLEEKDFYQWQSDVLLETERTLMLAPVDGPETAAKVLDALAHPLHQDMPPSSKTRKRTTAEMAADDEKAAEAERRMLIMDERIKPSSGPGAAASENAGTAAALGFGRFKTIQMVREKHEEQERQKKEEEAQAALQRRQQEEAAAAQAQAARAQEAKQRQMMAQRQNMARQQAQEQQRLQQAAQLQAQQQAALMAQNHGHPQQNGMMMNQQNSFQHPASMAQSSPVVRQQTPSMMNSSPMLAQGGFPMAVTTSQGAGSPPRPTSATIQNPNVANAMARQVSQQQHPSRNATPQMPQATPHLQNTGPSRQMSQTPRMPQASPAPGTPASAMPMPTPQTTNMTPEQYAMIQTQRQMQVQNGMSPGQQNPNQMAMTPEQIQNIRQQQLRQQQLLAQAQGNPQMAQALAQRQAMMMRQQQAQIAQQQRLMQAQQQQQAGSPHPGMQGTPQMNHGHPQSGDGSQQMTPQQQAARQQQQQQQLRQAQQTLAQLTAQYQGLMNVPQHVVSTLPPPVQMLLRQQAQRQQAARAQAMVARAQQAQHQGQAVAGSPVGDPEYMATLRNHQAMLAQQAQAHQAQQGNMNMNNMGGGMSMAGNMQFGNQNQGGDLSAQFQAMQRALNQQNGQSGGMQ